MRVDLRRAEPGARLAMPIIIVVELLIVAALTLAVVAGWAPLMTLDTTTMETSYDVTSSRFVLLLVANLLAVGFTTIPVLVATVIAAAVAAYLGGTRIALWIAASMVSTLSINPLVKLIVARQRPYFDYPLNEIGGYAFPSGHAAAGGAMLTIAVLGIIVSTGRGLVRILGICTAVALGFVVAWSRVMLAVHYPSDVLAGACLGSAITLGLWLLIVHGWAPQPRPAAITTGRGTLRPALVVNPSKVGDLDAFVARVHDAATQRGWSAPLVLQTSIEDPGYGQTREALDAKVDLIVAAGGDGTVRAVCEVAARSGVAVGILPYGTGNLLARNLDIPLNAVDALDVAFSGQDQAIDLAGFESEATGRTSFLVMAGLGLDAAIMAGVNDDLKNKVGYAAYFVAGIRAMMFPRVRVMVRIDDDEERSFKARTVVLGNVGSLQGGITLLPDAEIDDGVLDVVIIAPKHFWGWLPVAWRIVTRRPQNNKRLTRLSGQHIEIIAEKPVPMQLDGDHVGEGRHIVADVAHGVVLVRVPADLHHD